MLSEVTKLTFIIKYLSNKNILRFSYFNLINMQIRPIMQIPQRRLVETHRILKEYYLRNIWAKIQLSTFLFQVHMHFCLMLLHYIDYNSQELFGLEDTVNMCHLLPSQGIPLSRESQDKGRMNSFGHRLLDICKTNDLFIVNGRIGSDAGIGQCTSKETSVVDYVIASVLGIGNITGFSVADFNPLFSDVHCALNFKLSLKHEQNSEVRESFVETNNQNPKWKASKKDEFIGNINTHELHTIINDLSEDNIPGTSCERFINDITDRISKLFDNSANITFDSRTPKKLINPV